MDYKLTKSTLRFEFAIYTVLFVILSLYFYVANDEAQPLIGILRPEYLIPCCIYSLIVILISISIFKIVKTIVQKGIALGVAVFLGIPAGIYILFQLTNWLFG